MAIAGAHAVSGRAPDPVRAALALYRAIDQDDRALVLALTRDDVQVVSAASEGTGVRAIQDGHEGLRRWWGQLDARRIRVRIIVRGAREVAGRALCALTITNETDGLPLALASTAWTVISTDSAGVVASSWSFRSEEAALAAAHRD